MMENDLTNCINQILKKRDDIVAIALRKDPNGTIFGIRGFEGWLSYELAKMLKEIGYDITLEEKIEYEGKHVYSDITLRKDQVITHVELGILDGTDRTTIQEYFKKYGSFKKDYNIVLAILYFGIYKENRYHESFLNQYGFKDGFTEVSGTKYWLLVKSVSEIS